MAALLAAPCFEFWNVIWRRKLKDSRTHMHTHRLPAATHVRKHPDAPAKTLPVGPCGARPANFHHPSLGSQTRGRRAASNPLLCCGTEDAAAADSPFSLLPSRLMLSLALHVAISDPPSPPLPEAPPSCRISTSPLPESSSSSSSLPLRVCVCCCCI